MNEPSAASTLAAPEDAKHSLPAIQGAADPVFLVGSLRSGVSILFASLWQHPRIVPVMESRWITYLAASLQHAFAEGVRERATAQLDIMGIELEEFYAHFGGAIDSLLQRDTARRHAAPHAENGATAGAVDGLAERGAHEPVRWMDASPDTCFHIFGLHRLFPRAKFVHVLRDAPSVVRTLTDESLRASYRSQFRAFTEEEAYEHWLKSVSACVEAEQAFGSDTVLRIRRDHLVEAPEPALRACLDFLELPFAEACLRPFR